MPRNACGPWTQRTETRVDPYAPNTTVGGLEEYRYDALGRRVLVRARRDSLCYNQCQFVYSTIKRIVWDGDQILYEMRYWGGDAATTTELERDTGLVVAQRPPYGRVAYTHGLGIDAPLSIIRMNYSSNWNGPVTVAPHTNWRGNFDAGSFDNGTRTRCVPNTGYCVLITWPAENESVYEAFRRVSNDPDSWFGDLISEQRDMSGQQYKRNRYYDPVQGRFTQEDPIGLAGGLNLYGFSAGDPIGNADPFGLVCHPQGADKLVCTGAPGDWWTIRGFLGGRAGQSVFDAAKAAGLTKWNERTCQGGFITDGNTDRCDALAEVHANLILSGDPLCITLGVRAADRFEQGRYRLYNGILGTNRGGDIIGTAYPRVLFWGSGTTVLSSEIFGTGKYAKHRQYLVAHEETHHLVIAEGIFNGIFGEGPAIRAGLQCR